MEIAFQEREPMTVADDLRGAADHIEMVGWNQGKMVDRDTGAVCVRGALLRYDAANFTHQASRALMRFLGLKYTIEDEFRPLVAWNDDPTTTKELVIKSLRACADALEEIDEH